VNGVLLAGRIRRRSAKKGGASMNATWKAVVAVALIASIAVVFGLKQRDKGGEDQVPTGVPRLVDLGSVTCIPCKMMAPILEEIKKEYAGRLSVEFYDVVQNPAVAKKYGMKLMPTQIFFDASGKELFRHEGFFAKDDILAKWKELGVDLSGATE
jgi:thioredoxin 1